MTTSTTAPSSKSRNPHRSAGFTLIELMIVVAIIAIILTIALPVYTDYTIRAKIGEALSVGAAAKTATAATCTANPELTGLDNAAVGYDFEASSWVEAIAVSGDCSAPVITISTRNTGAATDPQILLIGAFQDGESKVTWACTTNARNQHVPRTCRS
jgi:type IV pilus assembly protein PilA